MMTAPSPDACKYIATPPLAVSITVITPVFNSVRHIDACIASVAMQQGIATDHVIVDGASTDGTTERLIAAQSLCPQLSFISEPDQGLYDAMNKGIALAKGDWLLFLGADDVLASPTVLAELFTPAPVPATKILYGNACYDNGVMHISYFDWRLLFRNQLHHQSALYHKSVFFNNLYNTEYKIYADYALNIILLQKSFKAEKRHITVSICGSAGISGRATRAQIHEICRVRRRTIGFSKSLFGNIASVIKMGLKKRLL
jgi:putative colanic acid biosynthesis glycosyltransferase